MPGPRDHGRPNRASALAAIVVSGLLGTAAALPAAAQTPVGEVVYFDRAPTLDELEAIFEPTSESLSLEGRLIVNDPSPVQRELPSAWSVPPAANTTRNGAGQTAATQPRLVQPRPAQRPSSAGPAAAPGIAEIAIQFELDSTRLLPQHVGRVDVVGQYLQKKPSMSMLISGHTDSTGSEEHNLALSMRRAEAIKDRLAAVHGISPDRLFVEGKGERQPLPGLPSDDARNRRVAFRPLQ